MENTFWKNIADTLSRNEKLVLCMIFETKESTPGRQGFKMSVDENGNIQGTIGGGVMEHMAITKCKELLKNNIKYHTENYRHYGDTEGSTGMICYGEQLAGFILLDKSSAETASKISDAYNKNEAGVIEIGKDIFSFRQKSDESKLYEYSKNIYKELTGVKERVYIFGGGHVGLAVSQVMSILGFYVIVVDNREDVFTIKQNNFADEIVKEDFIKFTEKIPEDNLTYIVIVTPGHKDDKEVLRAVANKKVKYTGMMGSKSKVKITLNELQDEGVSEDALKKVYAPIGIPITSQTPAEIAISIAAQIIQIKNS